LVSGLLKLCEKTAVTQVKKSKKILFIIAPYFLFVHFAFRRTVEPQHNLKRNQFLYLLNLINRLIIVNESVKFFLSFALLVILSVLLVLIGINVLININ